MCTCIIFQDMAEDSVLVELQMNCDVVLFGSQVRLCAGLVHAWCTIRKPLVPQVLCRGLVGNL